MNHSLNILIFFNMMTMTGYADDVADEDDNDDDNGGGNGDDNDWIRR